MATKSRHWKNAENQAETSRIFSLDSEQIVLEHENSNDSHALNFSNLSFASSYFKLFLWKPWGNLGKIPGRYEMKPTLFSSYFRVFCDKVVTVKKIYAAWSSTWYYHIKKIQYR